jgi:curved DNA-binding protein CbpA
MSEESFDDYYEYLQISPNADLETIERIYRLLAKKYHTDNKATGNLEAFELITRAYRILSNPEKRAAYDVNYEEVKARQWKAISKATPSEKIKMDEQIRRTILSVLYIKRRENPSNSGVGAWQLEKLMGWPQKTLEFHTWYLKEKSWIKLTDTGGFAITASGVDEIEKDGLILGKDRLLTEPTESFENYEGIKLIEGDSLETVEKHESAIRKLKRKVASNPNNLADWVSIAYFNMKLGRDDEATEAANEILKIDSNFSLNNFLSTLKFKYPDTAEKIATLVKNVGLP